MATTQKAYKRAQRLSRYVTQLPPFIKGMFWSDQIIPDGFAKAIVNLDISDTNNYLKPRAGYVSQTGIVLDREQLGRPHLLKDLYYFDDAEDPTTYKGLKTVVLSFGKEDSNYITNNYWHEDSEEQTNNYSSTKEQGFAFVINDGVELSYDEISMHDLYTEYNIGGITSNNIPLVYNALNITHTKHIPIYTLIDHELYCFSTWHIDKDTDELAPFELTKLQLHYKTDGTWQLLRNVIEPLELTPAQAYTSGFNMLSNDPYRFVNKSGANALAPIGVVAYNVNNPDVPTLTFRTGESYDLHCKYQYTQAGDSFHYKVEILDLTATDAERETLIDYEDSPEITCDTYNDLIYRYTPTLSKAILFFTLKPVTVEPEPEPTPDPEPEPTPEDPVTVTININRPSGTSAEAAGIKFHSEDIQQDPNNFFQYIAERGTLGELYVDATADNKLCIPIHQSVLFDTDKTVNINLELAPEDQDYVTLTIRVEGVGPTDLPFAYLGGEYLHLTNNKATVIRPINLHTELYVTCDNYYTSTIPVVCDYDQVIPSVLEKKTDPHADDPNTTVHQFSVICNDTAVETPLINFDLSTCKGMVNWFNCLGVYGIPQAPNTLFFSVTGNAGYFPYPYNVLQFNNEILAAYNYLDYLLVVTKTDLYLLTMGTSILNSTQRCILTNLNLSEVDANNIQILKDQIFIKTRNKFYVLKPNAYTSDATDLKNYDNSLQLSEFMTSFYDSLNAILTQVLQDKTNYYITNVIKPSLEEHWPEPTNFYIPYVQVQDIVNEYSEIKQDCVYYNYLLKVIYHANEETTYIDGRIYKFSLVYNIITRTWVTHLYQLGSSTGTFASKLTYTSKYSSSLYCFNTHENIFAPYKIDPLESDTVGLYYADSENPNDQHIIPVHARLLTYVDTGYVSLEVTNEKRFREIQFNLKLENNTDKLLNGTVNNEDSNVSRLTASTTFLKYDVFVDGKKQTTQNYDTVLAGNNNIAIIPTENLVDTPIPGLIRAASDHLYDYYSEQGGTTNVESVIIPDVADKDNIYQPKTLDDPYYANYWMPTIFKHNVGFVLDLSHFSNNDIKTLRVETKGKGRAIKLQLVISTDNYFELSNINFVYRTMNAR